MQWEMGDGRRAKGDGSLHRGATIDPSYFRATPSSRHRSPIEQFHSTTRLITDAISQPLNTATAFSEGPLASVVTDKYALHDPAESQ